MFMPGKLKDRVVVVTGASSGVGRATARAFAEKGSTVVVTARRSKALEELADECRALGVDALAIPADVTDPDALDEVARRTAETFGRIDIWVNNAAVSMFARLEEAPLADIRAVIDTDVMGYINGARAALPWMREQGRGVLINVGSVLSNVPGPYLAPYVIGKTASKALAGCLRTELLLDAPKIKACSVFPGAIDTPFFEHSANYTGRRLKPLKPTYDPARVAAAIVSCARRPRREIHVGFMARLATVAYRTAPGLTERVISRQIDRKHFTDEWAPPTAGNLYEPMTAGTEAEGGWGHGGRKPIAGAAVAATGLAAATAAVIRHRRAA
jgi:short-subunit dehydrogenase